MSEPNASRPASPRTRFRKADRIRLRSDFRRVLKTRNSAANDVLVVYVAVNGLRWSRLGISVGRRIGNAVTRNRLRRRLRAAFCAVRQRLPEGLDIVCIARRRTDARAPQLAPCLEELVNVTAGRT